MKSSNSSHKNRTRQDRQAECGDDLKGPSECLKGVKRLTADFVTFDTQKTNVHGNDQFER
jgi:hypothetical protein